MKKMIAFLLVSFLSASASFAAVGVQGKADCKDIIAKVEAKKAAAAASAPSAPSGTSGAGATGK